MSVQLYISIFAVICLAVSMISAVTTRRVMKKEFLNKIKLDITVGQMWKAEKTIREFFAVNNLKADESIENIAKILKVEQGGIDHGLFSQACLKQGSSDGKKIVVFRPGLSEKERNFVFAHELAHVLNGDEIPVMRPNGKNKPEVEQIADYTAAALLMPLDIISDYLEKSKYVELSARKRSEAVRQLCKKYNVTELIALRRIKEISILKTNIEPAGKMAGFISSGS